MLRNSSLGDRLNAVKKGQEIPDQKPGPFIPGGNPMAPGSEGNPIAPGPEIEFSFLNFVFARIGNLIQVLALSFLYGFGAKVIWVQDWGFLGILGVGILINQVFSLLSRSKLFR